MRRNAWGKVTSVLLLVAVLLGSFGLRLWGSGFGLPAYTRYHPDEHALVDRAAAILWTGDWNLHRFNYPPLYAYFQAGAYALYFLYGITQDLWRYVPTFVVPNYYLIGRLQTALFGTLTILIVYLTGRLLHGRRTGLLAAALLGGNYLHVIHSHYATFDVMLAFWVSLVLLFSSSIVACQESSSRQTVTVWYFLAGLSAGLAGATKYNGAVVYVVPLLAYFLASPWDEWGKLSGRLALATGAFLLGFFGGNPFALGNLPDFLNDLAAVLHHYGTEHPGFEGTGNWRWYPMVFLTSADAVWIVAGTIGLMGLLLRRWKLGLLLITFPLVYYLMVSRFIVRFERNMVPLLPFLALGGGWLADTAADWLGNRFRRNRKASHALASLGTTLLLALPLAASISFDTAISQTDHREIAGQWVEDNIEEGSKIAIEHYSIPFDYDQYHVEDVLRISNHNLDWYQQEDYDLLIISDGIWETLRRQPESYAEEVAVYNELVGSSTLLAEFVPEPPPIVVAGYPTVEIYHYPPVRIYQVPK